MEMSHQGMKAMVRHEMVIDRMCIIIDLDSSNTQTLSIHDQNKNAK